MVMHAFAVAPGSIADEHAGVTPHHEVLVMISIESQRYEQDGFLIIRGILDPARLADLRQRSAAFIAQAMRNPSMASRPHRLDLTAGPAAAWPVELLNTLADPWILGVSEILSRSRLAANQMQLSVDTPDMQWHRDQIFLPPTIDFDVEAYHAETPFSQIQWNLPLYDDSYLQIVPGSHRRHDAIQDELAACGQREGRFLEGMPGAITVALQAGDGVVYNNNLLHGVRRDARQPRRQTLHWFWVRAGHADPYGWSQADPSGAPEQLDPRVRELFSRPLPAVESSPHFRGHRAAAATSRGSAS